MMFGNSFKKFSVGLTAGAALCSVLLAAPRAQAEITLYDKDGWSVKTDGLAQGFFMHTSGDAAPVGNTPYVQMDFLDTAGLANADGSFASTRFRSGWTGGRFNWRITNQMTDKIKVSAYLGVAYSISTQNSP